MKSTLLQLLEMTSEMYDRHVLENYFLWCNLNSFDDQDCQKLLANAALFNWWYRQYSNLEQKFVEDACEYYGKADKHVMRQLYTDFVIDIRRYYSKPLLKTARNHKPITPQFN